MMNQNKPFTPDSKNLILAMVLSMVIITGWQWLFGDPLKNRAVQQQQTTSATVPGQVVADQPITREAALAASPRVPIETPELQGSINLTGGSLDDLHLLGYREKFDPASPTITLLTPSGVAHAYFAEHGFIGGNSGVKTPDAKSVWTVTSGAKLTPSTPVTLTHDNGEGLIFTKTFSLTDKYVLGIEQKVTNNGKSAVDVIPYGRLQRQDTPKIQGIWVFFEGLLGVQDGKLNEIKYADVAKEQGKVENGSVGGWAGFTDNYWATALIPDQKAEILTTYQHIKLGARDGYQVDYRTKQALNVAPGASITSADHIFAGAKVVKEINAVGDKYGIDKFDRMIDWGWFPFLTKPMFWLLDFFKGLLGNFGLAILCVTVLVKAVLFPLANKSYASMSNMKKLQPAVEALKTKHGDDRMGMQQEMMELYKKEKVSPLSGCLPVVIQIPIFFALYKVIYTTIDLRHAPFFGWIKDLSAPDPTSVFNLFGILPFSVPAFMMIGVFPLLMGITMWVQMKLNPAPADPVQAAIFNYMPLIFTFSLSSFPAGLVIYWAWSNFLSIIQQSYIMKRNGVDVDILGNIRDSVPFLKKKPVS
jgi:YidC/Oxa1 family membrane protein insertase